MGLRLFCSTYWLMGWFVVAFAFPAKPAEACSCMVLLRTGRWWPSSGKVPANAKGLVFTSTFAHMVLSKLKTKPLRLFVKVEAWTGTQGRWVSTPFRVRKWSGGESAFLVEPKGGFVARKRYRFTVNWSTLPKVAYTKHLRKTPPLVAEVTVSPQHIKSMTVPLALKGPYRGSLRIAWGASCFATILASIADVSMKLPKALAVFRNVFFFETRVDGAKWSASSSVCSKPLPGESWVGRGHDRVFTDCSLLHPGRVRPGVHSVVMEAILPGTSIRIRAVARRLPFVCKVKKRSWWWGLW
ncbi:MAG: hypothetical protein EP343_27085 [Deltaproteobacteria bacterium]|nr:MAG: hypothetical protein EP343_27085 [Deltaproteobacteria bacterium]